MRNLLLVVIGLFMAVPAYADDIMGGPYTRMNGDEVASDTATQITYSFGYWSDNIRVCLEDDSAQMYMRLGTVAATSSTIFIDGLSGSLAGSAAPLFTSGDGTDVNCQNYPVRANAVTLHQVTVGTATAHVQVFGK